MRVHTPKNPLDQILPLLSLLQQKKAQEQAAADSKKRNQILALDASNRARSIELQAERDKISNRAAKAQLEAFKTAQDTKAAAEELVFGRAKERASVDRGGGAFETDLATLDREELAGLVALGDTPGRTLLTEPELTREAQQDAGLRLTAAQTEQSALTGRSLNVQITQAFAETFPSADPTILRDMLNNNFSRFESLGSPKARQAFLQQEADRSVALFSIESANARSLQQVLGQMEVAAQQGATSVTIAQINGMRDMFSAMSTTLKDTADAIKSVEEAGQGEQLIPLGQRLFSATNALEQFSSLITGQPFNRLDPGTTNPLFDFGGERTSLIPSGADQNLGFSPITPSSVAGDVAAAGGDLSKVTVNAPGPAAATGVAPFEALFNTADTRHALPPGTMRALTFAESAFNPKAKSSKGAEGLTQLMPGTARDLGVTDRKDPAQSVAGGAKYLRQQVDEFGSLELGLAAFNWGPENLRKHMRKGGTLATAPKEVRDYVAKVIGGIASSGGPAASIAQDTSVGPPTDQLGGPPILDPRDTAPFADSFRPAAPEAGLFSPPVLRLPGQEEAGPGGLEGQLQSIGELINRQFR